MTKAALVGEAAHITSASPNGPRYDASLSPEERRHINNGIWLCNVHARDVDIDANKYPVDVLREWKKIAEEAADAEKGKLPFPAISSDYREIIPYLKLEPDNSFRYFGAKVVYDPFTIAPGIVVCKLSLEPITSFDEMPDLDEDARALLGRLAVQAYLAQHLTYPEYMHVLVKIHNRMMCLLEGAKGGYPTGQQDNFHRFKKCVTEWDFWKHTGIEEGSLFDAIAGLTGEGPGQEYQNFLFDITPFWNKEMVKRWPIRFEN